MTMAGCGVAVPALLRQYGWMRFLGLLLVLPLLACAAEGEELLPSHPDYWPPGYERLAEYCPETFVAKWTAMDYDDPKSIGDVEFRADGISVWSKHGTIPYRIPPGDWGNPVLELRGPLSGTYADEGPYLVIEYPYLSWKGSGGSCHMYLNLCPTIEDTLLTDRGKGYDANCTAYNFSFPRS